MTAINTTYKILNFVSEITSTDFITGMKEQCPAAFWQPSTITTIYTGHKQETKKSKPIFSRRWSKRANRWKIVIVKEKKDYSYFPILCANVLQAAQQKIRTPLEYKHDPQRVAPTIASLPAPATAQLVQEHLGRF